MEIDQVVEQVRKGLLGYFGAVGAAPGHRFSVRDFNLHVMMNFFAAAERAGLDVALGQLLAEQILTQVSETEYVLAPAGLALVGELRSQKAQEQQVRDSKKTRRPRPTFSRPPITAPAVEVPSA